MSDSRRARQYKNQGRDTEDGRRKRTDASIELRKLKKDDQIMKRRNVAEDVDVEEPPSPLKERSQNTIKSPDVTLPLNEIMSGILGSDLTKRMQAVQSARRVLSREKSPPIDEFIVAGAIPHLVRFLECFDNPALQFEAAWALTNIASGTCEQTNCVVKAGAVTRFVGLLKCEDESVCEQAVWALGNIAGDGPVLRDLVIKEGAVDPLLALVKPTTKVTFLRNLAWTLSNLCRNKNPSPPMESCVKCLPVFARMLNHSDNEVLSDTCWALSYITDASNDKIQTVLDTKVLPRLVELLYHEEPLVVTPALRTVGNIVTGDDKQTQAVVETPGALQAFPMLLNHSRASIKKEAAWAVSNITAGNQNQIQAVIDANIIPSVIELMATGDFKSQKEAAWVITNLTSGGSVQQTGYAVQAGCLPPLIEMLTAKEAKTTMVVLDAINNILVAASRYGAKDAICVTFEELGGLEKLEALQEHDNEEIYLYALRLIEHYFSAEGDEDTNLAPSQQGDQFEFTSADAATHSSNGFSF